MIFGADSVPIKDRRRLRCPFVGYGTARIPFFNHILWRKNNVPQRTMIPSCEHTMKSKTDTVEDRFSEVMERSFLQAGWCRIPTMGCIYNLNILEYFLEFRTIGWEGFDLSSNTRAVSRWNCQYLSASPPLVTSNTRPSRNACACRFIKQEKSQRALAEALLSDSHAACSLRQALCLEDERLAKTVALLCDAQRVMPQSQSILVLCDSEVGDGNGWKPLMKKCPVQFLWLRWSSELQRAGKNCI